jgi:50S ribosomal protein L16 3-hydroxylase
VNETFLKEILSDEQYVELLDCFKKNTPFFIQKLDYDLDIIESLSEYSSLNKVFSNWQGPIDIHLVDKRDESSSLTVSSAEAIEHFNSGLGFLINDINEQYLDLNSQINSIKSELGVPQISYGRSLLYGTPKNGGSATHFDQNFNIVLQLSGKKTWKFKLNEFVDDPLTRHALNGEYDPELQSYLSGPFPESIDDFSHEYCLEQGSFLFVPIGYWHNTFAHEDSLALNFTYTIPSWAEVLLTALRARLVSSPEWRQRVKLLNNSESLEDGLLHFQSLINSLGDDLPHWNGAQILSMLEGKDIRGR